MDHFRGEKRWEEREVWAGVYMCVLRVPLGGSEVYQFLASKILWCSLSRVKRIVKHRLLMHGCGRFRACVGLINALCMNSESPGSTVRECCAQIMKHSCHCLGQHVLESKNVFHSQQWCAQSLRESQQLISFVLMVRELWLALTRWKDVRFVCVHCFVAGVDAFTV